MKNKLEKERVKQINWKEKGIIMFVCKECGAEVNKWTGKCPVCGAKSRRVANSNQNLCSSRYVPPPKAKRKFGDRTAMPHKNKRWI